MCFSSVFAAFPRGNMLPPFGGMVFLPEIPCHRLSGRYFCTEMYCRQLAGRYFYRKYLAAGWRGHISACIVFCFFLSGLLRSSQ
jgi:hypothetical protein